MGRTTAAQEWLTLDDPLSPWYGEHRGRYLIADVMVGTDVLDIGSGSGYGIDILARDGRCVVGLDTNTNALSTAIGKVRPQPLLVQGDACALPVRAGAFDTVTCFEVLEHLTFPAALVAEIARCLGPQGTLLLSTPNRAFGNEGADNPFHVREFDEDELASLLRGSFQDVSVFGYGPKPEFGLAPFWTHPKMTPRSIIPTLAWKLMRRLPRGIAHQVSLKVRGRPVHPDEQSFGLHDPSPDLHCLFAVCSL